MNKQQEKIRAMTVKWFDEWHEEIDQRSGKKPETVRLSIFVTDEDSHHIEFKGDESRYRVSGLLHRLAQSLAEGVGTKAPEQTDERARRM